MELVTDEVPPRLFQRPGGVFPRAEPRGQHRGAFGQVRLALVGPVKALGGGHRGVAAHAVGHHQQLLAGAGQDRPLRLRQLSRQLPGPGGDRFRQPVPILHGLVDQPHGFLRGRAAGIAGAVIAQVLGGGQRGGAFRQRRVAAGLFAQLRGIRAGVQRCDHLAAVDPPPHAHVEGGLTPLVPGELLGGKRRQPHVAHHRGQRAGEAEAVRQEDIVAGFPEFPLEKAVAVQDVAHQRLRRGGDHVAVLPGGTDCAPAPFGDIPLQFFIVLRVILLDEVVAVSALKIEPVMGIPVQQREIAFQRILQKPFDRVLQRPVPDRVQMGGGHHIYLWFFHLRSVMLPRQSLPRLP